MNLRNALRTIDHYSTLRYSIHCLVWCSTAQFINLLHEIFRIVPYSRVYSSASCLLSYSAVQCSTFVCCMRCSVPIVQYSIRHSSLACAVEFGKARAIHQQHTLFTIAKCAKGRHSIKCVSLCSTPRQFLSAAGSSSRQRLMLNISRQLSDVFQSANRSGPIILSREEMLRKLCPLLGHSEAKDFFSLVKLAVKKMADEQSEKRGVEGWLGVVGRG